MKIISSDDKTDPKRSVIEMDESEIIKVQIPFHDSKYKIRDFDIEVHRTTLGGVFITVDGFDNEKFDVRDVGNNQFNHTVTEGTSDKGTSVEVTIIGLNKSKGCVPVKTEKRRSVNV